VPSRHGQVAEAPRGAHGAAPGTVTAAGVIGIAQGASIVSYLLGFIVPGVVVFLLLNAQSERYHTARGISH
jgi:hypothetical protein